MGGERHALLALFPQRLDQITAGYADQDNADPLRADPRLKLVCGRLPERDPDLASPPTRSRFANGFSARDCYRRAEALGDGCSRSGDASGNSPPISTCAWRHTIPANPSGTCWRLTEDAHESSGLDEAGRMSGANGWQILWLLVVPQIGAGIAAGGMLVFALAQILVGARFETVALLQPRPVGARELRLTAPGRADGAQHCHPQRCICRRRPLEPGQRRTRCGADGVHHAGTPGD